MSSINRELLARSWLVTVPVEGSGVPVWKIAIHLCESSKVNLGKLLARYRHRNTFDMFLLRESTGVYDLFVVPSRGYLKDREEGVSLQVAPIFRPQSCRTEAKITIFLL